jgi:dTDP-4-dehydrorhamnose 3,5-epimerase
VDVEETTLPGVLLIQPDVFGDERGHFLETYRRERYAEAGIGPLSEQDNLSFSQRGVLRGLHLQNPMKQAKLCQALVGEVFDVAADVRVGSPTFGQWVGVTLSGESRRQLYIPAGFAHGFCALSETALFSYKCSERYAPEAELTIRWDDPTLAIEWPIAEPLVSAKDAAGLRLDELGEGRLPTHDTG